VVLEGADFDSKFNVCAARLHSTAPDPLAGLKGNCCTIKQGGKGRKVIRM